jgi:CheY-like chemotaxis protein
MPINLPVTILLIEDDPGHARLIEINLRRALVTNDLVVLRDGQEAVKYLFNTLHRGQQSMPWLILLDLNLPGLDGYQVLSRLKTDERTKHIPVIILTTTDEQQEIERCYALGCNVYITKPVEYAQFADAIRKLGLFLSVVKMPNGE